MRGIISALLVVLLLILYWWIQSKTDYFWCGWSSIIFGAILLVCGSLGLASQEWSLSWLFSKVGRKTILFIFAIIIAVGGTLTTKGWNIISFGEQRNNLIRAITQEWLSNSARLVSPPMKGETHYVKEDGEHVWRPFPTLRTNALNTILSSGFWDYGNQMDRKFLDVVADYEKRVIAANRKFRSYDDFFSKIKDPNERIMRTKEVRRLTYEKDWFKSLENRQNQVGKLVWSEYKWAITTQLPEASELLRQTFQEKSPVGESEEVLSKKENTE